MTSTDGGPAPLVFIDGVRSDPAKMASLDHASIVSVDVIKGPAATRLYGADAAGGVIKITTRK